MPDEPEPAPRGHAPLAPYVAVTALGSIAYIASFTAASLAAREMTGRPELSGLPSSLGTVGTAVAVALLSAVMARRGRRAGLLAGWTIAVAGASTSVVAVAVASFPLLLVGAIAVGFGNASIQLSRYAAGDELPADRRASALGLVVWGSTAGAVLGPNLVAPAGSLASSIGRAPLDGAMAAVAVGFLLALAATGVFIRGGRAAGAAAPRAVSPGTAAGGRLALLAPAHVRIALVGLVTAQVVMVLIMTMTPVHIHDMGESLSTVGFVISAHTLGMFALSPLSGRLVARAGPLPVMLAGFATLLASAVLAALARDADIPVLTAGLFLLGYGWNLAFVAGSSLLASGAELADRIPLQGLTDSLVWSAGAAASASSGVLLGVAGYQTLAVVGGLLLVVPAAVVVAARDRVATAVAVEVPIEVEI
jgi:MFS family permease